MNPPVALLLASLALGCASRGGYAEPGPLSQNAAIPPPQDLQSGNALQPSTASGRHHDIPPAVNAGGAEVPDDTRSPSPARCTRDEECVRDLRCGAAACACVDGRCVTPPR